MGGPQGGRGGVDRADSPPACALAADRAGGGQGCVGAAETDAAAPGMETLPPGVGVLPITRPAGHGTIEVALVAHVVRLHAGLRALAGAAAAVPPAVPV
jgi:hypothetical protein